MKVFVTGVGGQLGHDVMNELRKRGHQAAGSDIQGDCDCLLDITDKAAPQPDWQDALSPDYS